MNWPFGDLRRERYRVIRGRADQVLVGTQPESRNP
jgi:hypothetical protein